MELPVPDVPGSCHHYETPQLWHLTWLTNVRTHRRERKMDSHAWVSLPYNLSLTANQPDKLKNGSGYWHLRTRDPASLHLQKWGRPSPL